MMKSELAVALAVVVGFSSMAQAQRPTHLPGSPAAVADSFLSRIGRADFRGATEYVDSASLEEFRRTQIANLRFVDSIEKFPPPQPKNLPPAVAEYFDELRRKHAVARGSRIEQEFGVKTIAEVEAMSAAEIFARWLEAQHPQTQMRRALLAAGRDSLAPVFVSMMGAVRNPAVVGAVLASDSVAYAVFQDTTAGSGALTPEVLPLRLRNGEWRVHASEAQYAIISGMCSFGFDFTPEDDVKADHPP